MTPCHGSGTKKVGQPRGYVGGQKAKLATAWPLRIIAEKVARSPTRLVREGGQKKKTLQGG